MTLYDEFSRDIQLYIKNTVFRNMNITNTAIKLNLEKMIFGILTKFNADDFVIPIKR